MYVKTRLGIFIDLNETRISKSEENLKVQKCTRTKMYKISKVRYSLWYLNRTEATLINSIRYDRYYQPSDSHRFIADLYLQIFQEETSLV